MPKYLTFAITTLWAIGITSIVYIYSENFQQEGSFYL